MNFVFFELLNHVNLSGSFEHDCDNSESNSNRDTQDLVGKIPAGISSQLDPETKWRVKDITQLKTFLKYLKAYSKIPVTLTKKFEGDIEGKINTELTNGQSRALKLQESQQSVEGEDSLAEILRTSSIVEPVFIQGLKQVINEVTGGKLKLK